MSRGQLRLELVTKFLEWHFSLNFNIQAEQSLSPLVYRKALTLRVKTLFFFFLIQLFTPVLQKHLWNIFTKFLWHATQIRAFFAKKVARGYSYSGAIVNLIRRDWWEKKTTTTQQAKLLHSHFFGGLRVGTGAMVLETRGYRVVRWFLEEKKKSPPPPIWALEQHWRAERRSCTMPSWAPTPPAAGCSCACRTRRCRSWGFPGWISRTLCLAWTAPETCRTQKHH